MKEDGFLSIDKIAAFLKYIAKFASKVNKLKKLHRCRLFRNKIN